MTSKTGLEDISRSHLILKIIYMKTRRMKPAEKILYKEKLPLKFVVWKVQKLHWMRI